VTIPKRVAITEVSHWHSVNDASYLHILRDLGCDLVGVSDRSARIAGSKPCPPGFESAPPPASDPLIFPGEMPGPLFPRHEPCNP
jgi:hypothetical protein